MPRSSETLDASIGNVTLTLADTEYSQALPAGTRYVSLQCRTAFDVRFAFVTGKVATPTAPYATIKSGGSYSTPEKVAVGPNSRTIFLASAQAGVVVEIVYWA